MAQAKKKLGKSEVSLISRLSDEDLNTVLSLSPQEFSGDSEVVCLVFQRDKEMDRWLSQSKDSGDFFSRVDGLVEAAIVEADARSKKQRP
jgi:hypothetical protein